MPTNFEPERLKPKLDIVEKPENRVHLTDSNGLRDPVWLCVCVRYAWILHWVSSDCVCLGL